MASPNLAIAHVAAAQNQKEVTVNDAIDKLDLAGNDTVDIDCTAGNTTVTAADYRENFLLRITGTPGADFTLTLPDGKRVAAIHNTTAKAATVRTVTLGSTVTLRAGELSIVGSRGTSLVPLAAAAVGGLYDIGLFIPGQPAASAMVFQFVVPRAIGFPVNLVGSLAKAGTAATSAASFTLRKNGSNIGTIDFAGGAAAGTFTLAGGAVFAAGDVLEMLAPSPQDATLADVSITLLAART
jgi:hypothetical protein